MRPVVELQLRNGGHSFNFSLRPVHNGRGEIAGIVPEGVDIAAR